MKKIVYSLFLILTCVATLVSCQKDESDFSLSAVIADKPNVANNSNAKVYIDPVAVNEATVYYARWHNQDYVNINGQKCTLSVNSTAEAALINRITPSNSGYTAVYPYSEGAVADAGATEATVTIPASQSYHTAQADASSETEYQVVDGPMVAYCGPDDNVLKFHNAAGIIRIHVTNNSSDTKQSPLKVHYISVETTDGSSLAGSGTVSTDTETPSLSVASNGSKSVTLDCCDDATDKHPVIAVGSSRDFYLAVAPFSSKQLKIKVMTEVTEENTKKFFIFTATTSESGSVTRNQIGHFSMSLTNSNYKEVKFLGAGTKDCPFLITGYDDLNQLRTVVNSDNTTDKSTYNTNQIHYLQTTDINLENKEWGTTRIASASTYSFSANYDGDGYSITHLPIALFGYAGAENSPNTIKNLTISGEYSGTISPFGGLVIKNDNTTHLNISNCTTSFNIKNTSSSPGKNVGFGGIVGIVCGSCEVENCVNTGNILYSYNNSSQHNGYSNYGGIVGIVTDNGSGSIKNCTNTGTIGSDPALTGTGLSFQHFCAGGIIGRVAVSSYEIIGCSNNGQIRHTGNRGEYTCGGVVGRVGKFINSETAVNSILIKNCTNKSDGYVVAIGDASNNGAGDNSSIGGICGCIYGGSGHKIEDCKNEGNVTWDNNKQNQVDIGGIIGKMGYNQSISADIIDCANLHNIKGSGHVSSSIGGILGYSYSNDTTAAVNIINCYNSHTVTGGARVGGIAGYSNKGGKSLQIFNCYNTGSVSTTVTGNVSNKACAGGIVGWSIVASSNGLATNCWSSGNITLYNAGSYNYKGTIAGYVKKASDINGCYGTGDNAYGYVESNDGVTYTKFTGFGTIGEVTTALCSRLNTWVGESSTYKTWQQSTTDGNPTEYPHF